MASIAVTKTCHSAAHLSTLANATLIITPIFLLISLFNAYVAKWMFKIKSS